MSCTFCTVHGAGPDLHFTAGSVLYNCVCDEYKSWRFEDCGNIVGQITPEISVVKYFSPVSFHFITHNLISEIVVSFYLHVWITLVVTDIGQ